MPMIQLFPAPNPAFGQHNSLGLGQVYFSSPSAPVLNPGDPYSLFALNEVGGLIGIGVAYPWSPTTPFYKYLGNTSPNGSISDTGTFTGQAPMLITDGNGILIAVRIQSDGMPGLFAPDVCRFSPLQPAPPPPMPSLETFEANVETSWTSLVPVVDVYHAGISVPYLATAPYSPTPVPTAIPPMYCVNDHDAATMAAQIGGMVVKLPPDPFFSDPRATNNGVVNGVLPGVNWILAPIDGVMKKGLGMIVAQATLMRGAPGGIDAALRAAFIPA